MSMPAVIVEIAFSVGASTSTLLHLDDAARGKLDTGTLGADVTWTDVTASVTSVQCSRGVSRADGPVLRYEAGKATITLKDTTRTYDPTNLSGPYVSAGVTQITPMRAVRIRALHNGVYYDVWRGFADSWTIAYPQGNAIAMVTLRCTDAFKVLGNIFLATIGAVGASENSGARISRVLTSATWALADRVIATGDTTLQATTYGSDALSLCQLAADTEMGEFYMDPAGRAYFRNRTAIMKDARSAVSQVTFGGGGGAELPYPEVEVPYGDEQLINAATITRVGGAAQASTADASASIQTYLTRTYERSDLIMEDDTTALNWGNMAVYVSKDPELRFDNIRLTRNPVDATETLIFTQALSRLIGDRITVKRSPPGGGTITQDCFIRGVSHSISAMQWDTHFILQSATKWSFFVLDDAILGKLDSNALSA